MVVTDIIEQIYANPPPNQPKSKVIAVGDIYSDATLDAPDANLPPKPPQQNANIPSRMVHDMVDGMRRSLIFQDPFAKAVKNGEGGNGIWMNLRGDATGKGKGSKRGAV
ncbi:unnamed protein product [Alternaria alternata]